jgi:hypothetical protein
MQGRYNIKTLLGIVLAGCIVSGMWMMRTPAPVLTKVLATYPVEDQGMLYTVLSDGGGATVPATYRYYLYRRMDDLSAVLESLRDDGSAFLVTRDHDAQVEVQGRVVKISVKKAVYSFHTPTLFRHEGGYTVVDIWLQVRPEE